MPGAIALQMLSRQLCLLTAAGPMTYWWRPAGFVDGLVPCFYLVCCRQAACNATNQRHSNSNSLQGTGAQQQVCTYPCNMVRCEEADSVYREYKSNIAV
jgi:hypothetical protein